MICPLCSGSATANELDEAGWQEQDVIARIAHAHPGWRTEDGACPACVQQALLEILLEKGGPALRDSVQRVWPIDPAGVYGALPTPLRMRADPRFTGRGVTLAMIDSAFYPHPDLVSPRNRIRAWVNVCTGEEVDAPTQWPGSGHPAPEQWHGLMTTAVAAGNGHLSHGLYRGIASDSELVLIQVRDRDGRISNGSIQRAICWIQRNALRLGIRVVNLSVAGDAGMSGLIDDAIRDLVNDGVTVVAAAGNDGVRRLVSPAASPDSITVGGVDDHNVFDADEAEVWHSNYDGVLRKPELTAPSLWVAAPLLPGTRESAEALELFQRRKHGDPVAEEELRRRRLVRPEYQLAEGTSFAAPIVSSVVCAMLEANPTLTPQRIRALLEHASTPVEGAARERQGAGILDAGHAVALAESNANPGFVFRGEPRTVQVAGSWNNWAFPGLEATEVRTGFFVAPLPPSLRPGVYAYKFLLDGSKWKLDPRNPDLVHDGFGGHNNILRFAE
ncbi:MAG: S8 family serine peptidase [Bryobacteraceae bacterium]|nr:S8 family serine peptidase [Bryobacteraceae bacterium]